MRYSRVYSVGTAGASIDDRRGVIGGSISEDTKVMLARRPRVVLTALRRGREIGRSSSRSMF